MKRKEVCWLAGYPMGVDGRLYNWCIDIVQLVTLLTYRSYMFHVERAAAIVAAFKNR